MRRAVLTALAVLGVAAGLAVTASSTSAQAYAAGMRGLALAAIVVVLEVTNTLGTLVWLTDARSHAKWQAGGLVGVASIVTGWCGALSYGPIGLVGPFFVLAGVHLANLAATTPSETKPVTKSETNSVATEEHEPEPVTSDDPSPADTVAEPAVTPGPQRPPGHSDPPPADDDQLDRVADLRAHARDLGRMPGRDAVKARYGVGSSTANTLREAAARPPLALASGGNQ